MSSETGGAVSSDVPEKVVVCTASGMELAVGKVKARENAEGGQEELKGRGDPVPSLAVRRAPPAGGWPCWRRSARWTARSKLAPARRRS